MNISYNWLKQYLNLPLSPDETAAALTSIGLECGGVEEVESIKGGLRGLVIGKVLTCVEHPDSDHLHITTVDLGQGGDPVQIVCGAPNVAAGQTVVVATVGTTLYDGDKEFKIKKSKIRGVESLGMICAEDEIGVGTSHAGIIVIDDPAVAPGTPAAEHYGLTSDYCLEVDLTPNRIDAASHYGCARDLAAWMTRHSDTAPRLQLPPVDAFRPGSPEGAASVEVLCPEGCTRYAGLTLRGVKVAESPQWLRDRLTAIGQRPINNIVDITNYILHGLGQPLHCFDLAKVEGGVIKVQPCPQDTPFTTLDGVERKLDARDLMICNATGPMCMAGVFGGLDSGVTDATTDIFLESACFNPTWVRKTSRRHALQTDSSFRFERGVDPNLAVYALKVAALLVQELAGGRVCGDIVDIYPQPVAPYPVTLSYSGLDALVGKHIAPEVVDSILAALEIEVTGRDADGDKVALAVPTYRVDVRRPCDVIEDVLRIYGYNNVEPGDSLHSCLSYKTRTDLAVELQEKISEQLTGAGFCEILNNSLTAESYYAGNATYPIDTCVRLLNPLSADLALMRRTLLYGGLETLAHNINRRMPDQMMYEFGQVYRRDPQGQSTAEAPLAPYHEAPRLALWLTGNAVAASWNRQALAATFYDLRAHVANILQRLGLAERELRWATPDEVPSVYAASMTVATRSGEELGELAVVAPAVLKSFDIKQPVMYAELRWDALVKHAATRSATFTPLPKTQPVSRDLALLLDNAVTFARVEEEVRRSERKLLAGVTLFDVYEGANLPAGKKSYAINIMLQDPEKTLTDKAIDAVMGKIVNNLRSQLGAELR